MFIAIAFLLFATLFISYSGFVEAYIITKWYGFIFGTILLVCPVVLFRREKKMFFDALTFAVIIFLGYLLLRMSLVVTPAIKLLVLVCFILLYIFFNISQERVIKYFGIIAISGCVLQALYGAGQWFGIFHSAGFRVTGSFDNPAGFAASLAAGFPFCFSLLNRAKIEKTVSFISMGIIAGAVALSGSRAGILAITITVVSYATITYRRIITKNLKYILPALLLITIFGFAVLVSLKKDSAVGRIFIWSNSIEMIKDKPVLGHSPEGFSSQYMLYQADYFEKYPDSKYAQLADNVSHPFNEYILLTIDYGLIGLILLIFVVIAILRSLDKLSVYALCLLSVAVFACFSYPLRYPFVWVLIAYSLSGLSTRSGRMLKSEKTGMFMSVVVSVVIITMTTFLFRDINFEYKWGRLAKKSLFVKSTVSVNDYLYLYKNWNGNPLFLYNYGAVLNQIGDYLTSIDILKECEIYLNDYDVQLLIADNYNNLEQWQESIFHFEICRSMCPNRFLPLYRQFLIYEATGDTIKANSFAKEIIGKPVKIRSTAIDRMVNEMKEYIKL